MLTTSLGRTRSASISTACAIRVEPRLEWRQILREVWRIQRDYFYDPKMHGVDWNAMWARWSPFLAHVHHRADLNLVIGDLIGELATGHEYVGGGDLPAGPTAPGTGLLGADFTVEGGRFRLARIHRGQNWNPGLRAPLTEPGVDAKVGDYLIAVDGVDVKADRELFAAFEATADRQVELTWSDAPEGGTLRRTTVVPVSSDGELRRRAWIEANRANVDRLSGGRLAYVYMPDTGGGGLAAFDRDFYSQLDKQGLILDERYNGGGKIADYVIGVLGRKVLCHWRTRDGWLARTPFGTLEGPKVMLINERAGSGGDALPWMFRKTGLGPLVGVRTWGGLVGISGYPVLMDGGGVTAAAFGIVDTDGKWVVENEGVAPDVEVFETPKDLLAGRDPQLETGVRLALEALEKNPPRACPAVGCPDPR
jgi:tricorn protease